jgi:hypothetical protein
MPWAECLHLFRTRPASFAPVYPSPAPYRRKEEHSPEIKMNPTGLFRCILLLFGRLNEDSGQTRKAGWR